MTPKRHLNVIASSNTDDSLPSRSEPHWMVLGTLLVLGLWLPLGMVGLWLSRWAAIGVGYFAPGHPNWGEHVASLTPIVGSFVLATFFGTATVARFGPRRLAPAAAVGGLSAALVCSLAAVAGALRPWLLGVAAYGTLTSIGVLSGIGGGRWGRRLRNAASLTSSERNPNPLETSFQRLLTDHHE